MIKLIIDTDPGVGGSLQCRDHAPDAAGWCGEAGVARNLCPLWPAFLAPVQLSDTAQNGAIAGYRRQGSRAAAAPAAAAPSACRHRRLLQLRHTSLCSLLSLLMLPADDSMAILAAFNSPEVEVLGLTSIYGNVPTAMATRNALTLCHLAGRPEVLAGWIGHAGTCAAT